MLEVGLRTAWLANLAGGAAAVAVGPTWRTASSGYRLDRRPQSDSIVASDLEVVTVTADSAVLTWTTRSRDSSGRLRPAPADTEVRIAPADGSGPARTWYVDARATPYHYAEPTGLEPGRAYRFEAYSDGVRAIPARTLVTRRPGTPESTGVFTTLVPPPGRLLAAVALANDVHYGEQVSGVLVAGWPAGLRHETADYPGIMLDALLTDLRSPDRAADHLIVAGDLTDCGAAEQVSGIRARLDAWGTLGRDYGVCRGNHDVAADGDPWAATFGAQRVTEHRVGELRLIGLDTTRPRGAGGTVDPAQLAQLRERLRTDPDRPTLVFGHHPVTSAAAVSNPAGPGFVLDRRAARALHHLYRTAPGVFLHHSGHTHRNRRWRADAASTVEFLEVAAVKEYPGGYALLRVYEGGYLLNFYKTRADAARCWSTRTRRQFFGFHPDHALGGLADRNHTVLQDFSGLSTPAVLRGASSAIG